MRKDIIAVTTGRGDPPISIERSRERGDMSHLVGSKQDSEYCASHRRYVRAGGPCELCVYEESIRRRNGGDTPRLQRCPECGEMSLLWYQCRNQCECQNLNCKLMYAEKDY